MTQLIVTLRESFAKATGKTEAYAERAAAAAMQIKGGMRCFFTLREGGGDGGSAGIGTMIDGRAKTAAGDVAEADIPSPGRWAQRCSRPYRIRPWSAGDVAPGRLRPSRFQDVFDVEGQLFRSA